MAAVTATNARLIQLRQNLNGLPSDGWVLLNSKRAEYQLSLAAGRSGRVVIRFMDDSTDMYARIYGRSGCLYMEYRGDAEEVFLKCLKYLLGAGIVCQKDEYESPGVYEQEEIARLQDQVVRLEELVELLRPANVVEALRAGQCTVVTPTEV